jgi:hypothetical protein
MHHEGLKYTAAPRLAQTITGFRGHFEATVPMTIANNLARIILVANTSSFGHQLKFA